MMACLLLKKLKFPAIMLKKLLFSSASIAQVLTCQAAIINIDVGRSAGATDATGYNNITEAITNNASTALVDSEGAPSGYSVTLNLVNIPNNVLGISTGNFASQTNFDTVSDAFEGTIAQSAFEDGVFLRDEIANGPSEFVNLVFTGLSPTDVFDFTIFGSRATNGLVTEFVATGATVLEDSLQPNPTGDGYDPLIVFSGLSPDINGEIELSVTAPGNSQSGALSFIQIETSTVPEPSSMALMLGGFALLAGRRRR